MTSEAANGERPVATTIEQRRSIRKYLPGNIDEEMLLRITSAGLCAPAAHHSRPWRFVVVRSAVLRRNLAEAMAGEWSKELLSEGIGEARISKLTKDSIHRLTEVPAIIVGCIDSAEVRIRPDDDLNQKEWVMAQFSLGAAMENIMLAAAEQGLGTCWIASPLYCPDVAGKVLELPESWVPQALVTIGNADPNYAPPARKETDPIEFILLK